MKKNINISNRLKECSYMTTLGSKIVDVGTDHAYLPIYLSLNKKVSHCIASDNKIGPLQNAKSNIKKMNLENEIEIRFSDGLLNIKENEVDEIIIAGMGGLLIIQILEKCPWKNKIGKRFILQPMNHEKDLRIYLAKKGYKLEIENAVTCMKKTYTVMKAEYTSVPYKITPIEEYIGKLKINATSLLYIKKVINDLNNRKLGALIKKNFELEKYYFNLIQEIKNYLSKGT